MKKPYRVSLPNQLDNPHFCPASPRIKRFLKKMLRRARRRDAKRNQEDALKQNRYRGWES